jgi:hypothetical protein
LGKLKAKVNNFRFKGTLMIVFIFALISGLLLVELSGVQINHNKKQMELLPKEKIVTNDTAYSLQQEDVLLLYSSTDPVSSSAYEQFQLILRDMKWGTKEVDLPGESIPDIRNYNLIIVLFSDFSYVGDRLIDICNWVRDDGGNVYFPLTIDKNAYSSAIENRIGIDASYEYTFLDSIYVDPNFMVGAGKAYAVTDGYESARTVQLNPQTTRAYAWEGDANGVPLIWEAAYGKGKFVVNNFGMCDKAYRGFFAASMSLFGDVALYPVINGSTFYLTIFLPRFPMATTNISCGISTQPSVIFTSISGGRI